MVLTCPKCENRLTEKYGRYFYIESGLTNVYIDNMPFFECSCGAKIPSIYQVGNLNDLLARELLSKSSKLNGNEIKFLRKNLRLSSKAFANYLAVDVTTLSKWENEKQRHSAMNDRFIRSMYMIRKPIEKEEARKIVDKFSDKQFEREGVDYLIVAKRTEEGYIVLRESHYSAATLYIDDFFFSNSNVNASSSLGIVFNKKSLTNIADTESIKHPLEFQPGTINCIYSSLGFITNASN